jgi:CDP-diacylglycerol--serine O-phosphatidyltransferase
LASLVWTATDFGLVREKLPVVVAVIAAVLTAGAGVLMVSNFRYHSFKKFDFRRRVPFVIILLPVLVIGVVSLDPPRILLLMAIVYALSAPLQFLLQRRSRRTKSP